MSLLDILDDYSISRIISCLPSPLDAPLSAICARMRALIIAPTKMTPSFLLHSGVSRGYLKICQVALNHGASVDDMLKWSFENRQCDLGRYALANGATNYLWVLKEATRRGDRALCEMIFHCMESIRPPRLMVMNRWIQEALDAGHPELCSLAITYGQPNAVRDQYVEQLARETRETRDARWASISLVDRLTTAHKMVDLQHIARDLGIAIRARSTKADLARAISEHDPARVVPIPDSFK